MEVIDLSSDDEKSPPKNRDAVSDIVTRKKEAEDDEKNVGVNDVEIVYNAVKNQKRCAVENKHPNHSEIKKMKFSKEGKQLKIAQSSPSIKSDTTLRKIIKIKPETLSMQCTARLFGRDKSDESDKRNATNSSSSTKTNGSNSDLLNSVVNSKAKLKSPNSSKNRNSFPINEGASSSNQFDKPQLTIKNKIKVCDSMDINLGPSTEVFESFLDACQSQDSSKDMETIISKLRKRYNNLQPSYARSGLFIELIRKKRDLISNDRRKLYLHISEVMAEMKARLIQNRFSIENPSKRNTPKPGTSAESGSRDIAEEELDLDELITVNPKDANRLKILEKTMRRCERYINKCEMAEVNFDDENDSHYIMAEKYKLKMVALYNKYCELTGESPDAARPYLRPKDLSVTLIPSLNHAITSFINMKITKMKKSLVHKKQNAGQLRFTDALIFPDYIDILNCVKKCNEEQNLQLNKTTQEDMAKAAFTELGRYLQRCRQADYYDTFSLYLEREDCDPAKADARLAEKLDYNQELGKKRMDQVFQDFVEKQNTAKISENGASDKVEDVEAGDDSMADSEDQHSEMSEDDEISIELNSDHHESETDELNLAAEDNLIQKSNDNVELDEPQGDSNSTDIHDIEVDKPQDDLNQKGNSVVKLDKPLDDGSQKSNEDVETNKPQGHSNQQRTIDVELHTHLHANKETTQNKVSFHDPDLISVQTTDTKSVDMDTSESFEVSIVDTSEIELRKEKRSKECVARAKAVLTTEDNRIILDQIKIDEKLNKTVDPSNSKKTLPVPSQIQEPASTVTRYEVNLMQAAKTLETNLIDGCSSAILATNVLDAPEVATTVKLINKEEEKKPILRLRQFAKPPGSWKDFQSPTKDLNENSKSNEMADAKEESIKTNKTLPVTDQASKSVKLTNSIPVGKSVHVKNSILADLKNKKSTVMIPTTLNTKHPKINVQSVTNNVTLNFNNQVKLRPKNSSAVSHALSAGKNVVKINETTKVITVRNNPGVIRITPNKEKISTSSNPIQTVDNSNREVFTIKKPAPQLRLVSQQTAGSSTQKRYQLITSKSATNRQGTIVRHIPIVVERGKKTIVQLVNHSRGGQSQNIIVPANATVLQNETCTLNQRPNSSASTVAGPSLKVKVSNINTRTVLPKVPHNSYNKVENVCQAPTDSIPTYLIE